MELKDAILSRRSARSYKPDPIPREIIDELIEMARYAPSGGNGQAHVFGIVDDPAIKRELALAAGGQMWIADAPIVIACCARLEGDPRALPEGDFGIKVNKLRWGEDFWRYFTDYPDWRAPQTVLADGTPLIPAEHICLAAAARGLSTCFVGYLDVARASEALGLQADIRCMYLLPVGYAAREPAPLRRKSADEISFYNTYKA